jgi:hypothetical protein
MRSDLINDIRELFRRVRELETVRRFTSVDDTMLDFLNGMLHSHLACREVTTNYTVELTTYTTLGEVIPTYAYICVDSTGGARTVTLPLVSVLTQTMPIVIKDVGNLAATNNITIARSGADTIDGATSKVINTNRGYITVVPRMGMNDWAVIT